MILYMRETLSNFDELVKNTSLESRRIVLMSERARLMAFWPFTVGVMSLLHQNGFSRAIDE